MKEEIAAGGIIVRDTGNTWAVLLMKDMNGQWTFPKGLIEDGEAPEQTAEREIAEEVGLTQVKVIELLQTIDYAYERDGVKHHKTVHYFLCRYAGRETPVPQAEEGVTEVRWMPIEEAIKTVGYSETNVVLLEKAQHTLDA